MKITISKGNRKMGAIPSVSLPPITTCAPGCKCAGKYYAAKLCRIYKNVRESYQRNYDLLNSNASSYFQQVNEYCKMQRFFRWHVSGDIVGGAYLINMVSVAENNPHCEFLAFTKQYQLVNDYLDSFGKFPRNLHIIFSEWPEMEMDNPHNLPVAHVIFKGQEPAQDWKVCGGNCAECACAGIGCWELKAGEHISFYEH
jgi:hypothetical protein